MSKLDNLEKIIKKKLSEKLRKNLFFIGVYGSLEHDIDVYTIFSISEEKLKKESELNKSIRLFSEEYDKELDISFYLKEDFEDRIHKLDLITTDMIFAGEPVLNKEYYNKIIKILKGLKPGRNSLNYLKTKSLSFFNNAQIFLESYKYSYRKKELLKLEKNFNPKKYLLIKEKLLSNTAKSYEINYELYEALNSLAFSLSYLSSHIRHSSGEEKILKLSDLLKKPENNNEKLLKKIYLLKKNFLIK